MILIKNNLKLILRCKGLVLFILIMVLVTGMLSSTFKNIMKEDFKIENSSVGYSFTNDCIYESIKPALEKLCTENDISAAYFTDGNAESLIRNGKVDLFVEFTDDGYTVYSKKTHINEAGMMKMLISSILSVSLESENDNYISEYKIDVQPIPDSGLYYTIAYTVYFIWCAMIVLGVVISSENKNRIGARFKTTPASSIRIYFGRFIPSAAMVSLLIGIAIIICTILYNIHWQSVPVTFLILFLGCIASAAVGTVVFSMIKNVIVSIAFEYSFIMYWGFFGGSFCPYMYATYADRLKYTSPIYYMTRALVETNTEGNSDLTLTTILILTAIIIVCVPLGMLIINNRKEQ